MTSPDLPKEVDLLIVGAGPAGTAAAFRAHELGVSLFVVDRNRLLGQLAEWAHWLPPKPVDYDYQEALQRPNSGPLVTTLGFENQTPADQLQRKWRRVYDDHRLPYREHCELVSAAAGERTGILAAVRDCGTGKGFDIRARVLVLALGPSQPRLPSLVGETFGLMSSLIDPSVFVGRSSCVIGSGPDAAEAVARICLHKRNSNDNTLVYWCHDKWAQRKLRPVGQQLLAAMETGLIRFVPDSEPFAAIIDDEGQEFVVVRSRVSPPGIWPESYTCLQFPKASVLFQTGRDSNEQLLRRLGISMRPDPDSGDKRLAVTADLESEVRGVFLIGQMLGPAYLEVDDAAEPSSSRCLEYTPHFFAEFAHGIKVAAVVANRLAR